MRIILLCFIVTLIGNSGWAQDEVNLDSLAEVIIQLPDDTVKLRRVYKLANQYKSDNATKLKYYRYGLDLAQRLGDEQWTVDLYQNIGHNHATAQQLDSALFYYKKAYAGYQAMNNLAGIASMHNGFLYVYKRKGKLKKAHHHANAFIETAEKLGDVRQIAKAYGKLGSLFFNRKYYDDALTATLKSYEIATEADLPGEIGYASRLLGDIYRDKKEPQKSLEYYQKTMDIYQKINWQMGIALTNMSIGQTLVESERYAEGLTAYAAARKFYQDYYDSGIPDVVTIYNIGYAHLQMGTLDTAIATLTKIVPMTEAQEMKDINWRVYRDLANAYGQLAQYDSAYHYSTKFHEAYAENFSAENNETMEELRTRFAVAEKENIILKQEQQLTLQRINLWIALAGLVFFAVAGLIFYRLNQQLKQRNQEKEFLIKEVHHRVKNNLQTLSSLLHMQSRHIEDEVALSAVQEGQHRVETMGLIHQKLYMGENLAAVAMQEYLPELGENLLDSFGVEPDRVVIDFQVEDIRLDVDSAIPISLIINELLTNALKYAFPAEQSGRIEVSLWTEQQQLCLKVADNGAGQRESTESDRSTKFGSRLIKILSKRLEGQFEKLETAVGYAVQMSFKDVKIV